MKPVIIIAGPVGAGKTTVAKELVKISPAPVAYIEGDLFWRFIAKVKAPEVHQHFRMIMRSMIAASVPFALNEMETVVDFSIPPWYLDTALKITKFREIPLEYVVLLPELETCAERAANRAEGVIADYSRYVDLYKDFAAAGKHILSDDGSGAESTAQRIRGELKKGKFRVNG